MVRAWRFTVDCSTPRISPVKKTFPAKKTPTLIMSRPDWEGEERRQSGCGWWGRWGTEHRAGPSVACHSAVPWSGCLHSLPTTHLCSACAGWLHEPAFSPWLIPALTHLAETLLSLPVLCSSPPVSFLLGIHKELPLLWKMILGRKAWSGARMV